MVIPPAPKSRGWLSVDLAVAIMLLLVALLPLAFSFSYEQKLCRIYYFQAVAMQIVDGEFEILLAGAWQALPEGAHPYTVTARAAQNLPPGEFLATRNGNRIRLEWRPEKRGKGGVIAREAAL